MKDNLNIELYRQRFQNTLVGKWISIEGTFFMMSDTFEFYADGKGLWTQSAGSGDCLTYFDWKITEPFVLYLLETKTVYPHGIGLEEADEEEEEEEEESWHRIEYDFKIIAHDCGKEVALCNKDSEHFYIANQRIGLLEKDAKA